MKILFLVRSLERGGMERQLVALARGLQERGHRPIVALFYSGGPLEADLRQAGVVVRSLKKNGRWEVAGLLRRLNTLLSEERPDVLHAYLAVPNVVSLLASSRLPSMKVVWGIRASTMDLRQYDWLSRMSYSAERRLASRADLIVVNSRAGLQHLQGQGFPMGKTVVVPNGIDTAQFAPDATAGSKLRSEWGVSDDEKLIGIVARIDPMKDHETFLQAAAHLARLRPEARFACVGNGDDSLLDQLQKRCESDGLSDRVIWAGARSDMAAVYNALDLATLTSVGEGFPNVVGEAMACGVPCVVTDVGDAAEIVGETGLVVPPRDPVALAHAWETVLSRTVDERAEGENARMRICTHFALEQLVNRTESLLKDLVTSESHTS